uniref:TSA: Wollemia nobilis Ref_Wollemi_Transcript_11200_1166 transcribed RNA sequence n=1 Tax=Wollemia nobilis TaxID=56998 RepID=A0A0C9S6E3_9CONI
MAGGVASSCISTPSISYSTKSRCFSHPNPSISPKPISKSLFHGINLQYGPTKKFYARRSSKRSTRVVMAALPEALLFDCDGVLVDTERDGHRISFIEAFKEKGLNVNWDVELYGELLKIGGGKERMTAYFNKTGWPDAAPKTEGEKKEFIASLHRRKTELFMSLIEKRLLPLRPGVARIIDEALGKGVKVAVCSTSNEKAVSAIVQCLLGPSRAEVMSIFAGDIVPCKKPDPAIYLLAATTLGVEPSRCVVIEDSAIGLAAAKAAGMKCIVTKSGYTMDEDFGMGDAVFNSIGDPPNLEFDLEFCAKLLEKQYVS